MLTGIVGAMPFGMQSLTSIAMSIDHSGEPMTPPSEGPNVRLNPAMNQSKDPMTRPNNTCIIIDRAFLRRMRPACAIPIAGV